ncbi:MAG TPA: FkbM family methyltransferase [Acidobacteriaceae bacterium]|nr:FkbM family methyltransferase [Acidobacteriaceae bacterium]
MRKELLYNPGLAIERIAEFFVTRRRFARLRGTIARDLNEDHFDSLELLDLVAQYRPSVIYDVGAHVGTWTRLAAVLFPGATIIAFEPIRSHCETFRTATEGIPNVALHQVALGAENRSAAMHIVNKSDASSFLPMTEASRTTWGHLETGMEQAKIVRLDDYVSEGRLPLPDLIKLDVQGYELEVLKGGEICLKHASAVLAEVSFQEYYVAQPLFADVTSFLNLHGFHPIAFAYRTPRGMPIGQTDALFVRRAVPGQPSQPPPAEA